MSGYNMFRKDVEHYQSVVVWKQNCIMCGHVSVGAICDECLGEAREKYEYLIAYLSENPKSTMFDVYGNTTIPFKMVKAFLELGWINLVLEDEQSRISAAGVLKMAKK